MRGSDGKEYDVKIEKTTDRIKEIEQENKRLTDLVHALKIEIGVLRKMLEGKDA